MNTKSRIAPIWAVVLLALVCTSAFAAENQAPSLSISPLAVKPLPGSDQYFLATFSDGSPVSACTWSASGDGENGTKLTTIDRNWAVFFTGSKAGVNYTISAECKSASGIAETANAFVFVQ